MRVAWMQSGVWILSHSPLPIRELCRSSGGRLGQKHRRRMLQYRLIGRVIASSLDRGFQLDEVAIYLSCTCQKTRRGMILMQDILQ